MTGLVGGVDLPAPVSDRSFEDYLPAAVAELEHVVLREDDRNLFRSTLGAVRRPARPSTPDRP